MQNYQIINVLKKMQYRSLISHEDFGQYGLSKSLMLCGCILNINNILKMCASKNLQFIKQ
ncbi:hypothetical protein X798_02741 [Onchocerca flexuosa]|uniref:Uncharacterized protein n=1 Tax=Onchocerca flexuosa TaxID=387005 RepID=A0A238BY02_9BILA|nr:hypothetical protein X798_02741 [Onchocerca flexuosa]